jgi:hypothetical protein
MTTNILKSELTKAIAEINDKSLLELLYKIINQTEKIKSIDEELSNEDWEIIESRRKDLKAGTAKSVTMAEIRNSAKEKLI